MGDAKQDYVNQRSYEDKAQVNYSYHRINKVRSRFKVVGTSFEFYHCCYSYFQVTLQEKSNGPVKEKGLMLVLKIRLKVRTSSRDYHEEEEFQDLDEHP